MQLHLKTSIWQETICIIVYLLIWNYNYNYKCNVYNLFELKSDKPEYVFRMKKWIIKNKKSGQWVQLTTDEYRWVQMSTAPNRRKFTSFLELEINFKNKCTKCILGISHQNVITENTTGFAAITKTSWTVKTTFKAKNIRQKEWKNYVNPLLL